MSDFGSLVRKGGEDVTLTLSTSLERKNKMAIGPGQNIKSTRPGERVTGIEPACPAWKAGVLPLNYTRMRRRSREGGARTRDPLLPKQVRYHCATSRTLRFVYFSRFCCYSSSLVGFGHVLFLLVSLVKKSN